MNDWYHKNARGSRAEISITEGNVERRASGIVDDARLVMPMRLSTEQRLSSYFAVEGCVCVTHVLSTVMASSERHYKNTEGL